MHDGGTRSSWTISNEWCADHTEVWRARVRMNNYALAQDSAKRDEGRVEALLTAAGCDKATLRENASMRIIKDEVYQLGVELRQTSERVTELVEALAFLARCGGGER